MIKLDAYGIKGRKATGVDQEFFKIQEAEGSDGSI